MMGHVHYQAPGRPNKGAFNYRERIADAIPEDMLSLSNGLLVSDICRVMGVSKTAARDGVATARAWAGMRARLGR